MGKRVATELHSSKQRMMSEKIPMMMVLVILMNLAYTAYGGTECLRKEGNSRHEDCHSINAMLASELHISHVCDGNMANGKCHGSAVTVNIVYCCEGKYEWPTVEQLPEEDNGSKKTKCTCEEVIKSLA